MSASDQQPFPDAEQWLMARGVRREPIRVELPGSHGDRAGPARDRSPSAASGGGLEHDVARAVAYARRATAQAPKSEARLQQALQRRGHAPAAIEVALRRCRERGIVDDRAFAESLVGEGRRRGHAPRRIRATLERRGIAEEVIEVVLAAVVDTDPEAAAYAVAHKRAAELRGVGTEVAYRRLLGYLARRGYPEALARKVARQAVFNDREPERTTGR
ncbi:MAG: recombination regulator RecX [Actinomycetota bacterium]|nr:recombination regulator RecX [Actinomycetota bacterium]